MEQLALQGTALPRLELEGPGHVRLGIYLLDYAQAAALADERHRDAAGLTFLVTLSGLSVAGIGSAFWGVVAGAMALFVQQYGRTTNQKP